MVNTGGSGSSRDAAVEPCPTWQPTQPIVVLLL